MPCSTPITLRYHCPCLKKFPVWIFGLILFCAVQMCKVPLTGGKFFAKLGRPYCKIHAWSIGHWTDLGTAPWTAMHGSGKCPKCLQLASIYVQKTENIWAMPLQIGYWWLNFFFFFPIIISYPCGLYGRLFFYFSILIRICKYGLQGQIAARLHFVCQFFCSMLIPVLTVVRIFLPCSFLSH